LLFQTNYLCFTDPLIQDEHGDDGGEINEGANAADDVPNPADDGGGNDRAAANEDEGEPVIADEEERAVPDEEEQPGQGDDGEDQPRDQENIPINIPCNVAAPVPPHRRMSGIPILIPPPVVLAPTPPPRRTSGIPILIPPPNSREVRGAGPSNEEAPRRASMRTASQAATRLIRDMYKPGMRGCHPK